MPDLWMDVDTAVAEAPINIVPLLDDTDFKSKEESVAYNATGLDLVWNFVTCAGAMTQTAVTPTDTGGNYDWVNQGNGYYSIEIPASGGASINNDTEGFGWFSGVATGVLPWRGPVIGFRRAALNDLLIEGSTASTNLEDFFDGTGYAGGTAKLTVDVTAISGDATAADNCELMFDGTGYAGGTTKLGVDVVAISSDTTAADNAELMFDGTGYAGGTIKLGVDAVAISGDATAADNLEAACDGTTYNIGGGAVVAASVTGAVGSVTGAVASVTQERGKYALGAVWIGPTANTNTASYTDGITTNPVSTIAAAKTIADALGLRRFYTIRTGTVQVGADMVGYDFDGNAWSLTTTGGSRDVSSSNFSNAKVVGGTYASTSAESHWQNCEFSDGVSVAAVHMIGCTFGGTLTLNAAGNYDFIDCASVVAGTSTPVFAIPAGTVNVSFRRWSGGIRITGITSATTISIDVVSGGTVTLEGADGNVQVRGLISTITDSRTGTPTLGQNAVVNITKINTECDTALTDIGLDHLVSAAVVGADVADNSIAAKLVSKSATADWDTYANTTDSLEAASDAAFDPATDETDADIKKINAVTVQGAGVLGNEWRPV